MSKNPLDDAHNLLPEELAKTIPPLYATQNEADPTAWVKLFTPDANWTFLITEVDPKEGLCFGLVLGHEREFGYFSLSELQDARGPLGLKVERDLYFSPTPVSKC